MRVIAIVRALQLDLEVEKIPVERFEFLRRKMNCPPSSASQRVRGVIAPSAVGPSRTTAAGHASQEQSRRPFWSRGASIAIGCLGVASAVGVGDAVVILWIFS